MGYEKAREHGLKMQMEMSRKMSCVFSFIAMARTYHGVVVFCLQVLANAISKGYPIEPDTWRVMSWQAKFSLSDEHNLYWA